MECSSCGAGLQAHQIRCPVCGKPTPHYHRQRRCLHCGTPAADRAETCLMCGRPIDSLPLPRSFFGGSWWGIGLGLLIIVGIVAGVLRYQNGTGQNARAAARPGQTPTPTMTATPGPTHTPTATGTPTVTPTPTPRTHIVQAGENPSVIAKQYGITVEELVALNNIDNVKGLRVGQELLIPPATGTPPGDVLPSQIVYVIEEGDTLLDIALRYGTTIEAIAALNPNVDLDLIYVGQDLVLPLPTPTPTATPTATTTPTPTATPPYALPNLLQPASQQQVTGPTLLFNWTATGLLAKDEFYVVELVWPNGTRLEHWTKSSSWRLSKEERPGPGGFTWTVTIMRQTGVRSDGSPTGIRLTGLGERRVVNWP